MKNFTDTKQYHLTRITTARVLKWLAPDNTHANAQREANDMTAKDKQDLAKWVRTAFWRRTSKLGIDFTTGRGHTIHFNTAADKTWDPSSGTMPNMRPGELATIKDVVGRMITTSEYRHATKQIRRGNVPAHLVNFYDEF
jgi:hypothetical protein